MAYRSDTPRGLVEAAVAGRVDIPEFQRGFVWRPEKVKNLLDSLCRDYPLGSILCWRAPSYQAARYASGSEAERLWIVDGQQRTTALCLLIGKKPYWFPSPEPWETLFRKCRVHVNLLSPPDEIELTLPNPIIEKAPEWLSVREVFGVPEKEVSALAIRLLGRIGKAPTDTDELARVMSILGTLNAAMRRELIVTEIAHDPVDVAEIFGRLNSEGTRVNEGDIAVALLAVRQEGWVRDELLPYLEDATERGFNFDPSFVIRAMVAIRRGSGRLRDVPREFWERSDAFTEGWRQTKTAMGNVIRVLREVGILSLSVLPARNALIPLFVLDAVHAHGDAGSLRRAFHWMLAAIRDGRYSGSALTAIDQDLALIRKAGTFTEAVDGLEARLRGPLTFNVPDFAKRYDEDDFLRLVLYLVVFANGAEDWKTGQRLGFDRSDNALNDGFRPEWHHFVPRGRLRRRADPPTDDQMNVLANIVVLSEGDNRRFSYSEPQVYLAKYDVPDTRVHQQFFPPDRALWSSERFEDLVEARKALLAEEANKYGVLLRGGRTTAA